MRTRQISMAVAIAALIAGHAFSNAVAQGANPPVRPTEELSAQAQKKGQAARTHTAKPVRTQTTRTVRTQTTKQVRTHTAKPVRTHTAKSVQTHATKPVRTHTAKPVQTHATKPVRTHTAKPVQTKTVKPVHTPKTAAPIKHGPGMQAVGPGKSIKRGPGAIHPVAGAQKIKRGPGLDRRVAVVPPRYWNGWRRPVRVVVIRDRWRYWGPNGWRTFVPFAALATFAVGAATFYPAGYVSMPELACDGITPDGNRLRWTEVPTEEGGSDWQCVAYSPQPNRVVSELLLPDEPATVAAAPVVTPAPAVAAEAPAASRRCELTIYSEPNLRGEAAPTDEDQADLGTEGWKNQIASVEIKSGTWDFFTGDNYSGEMMRLAPGSHTTLDANWTRRIGSFMCSRPAGA